MYDKDDGGEGKKHDGRGSEHDGSTPGDECHNGDDDDDDVGNRIGAVFPVPWWVL